VPAREMWLLRLTIHVMNVTVPRAISPVTNPAGLLSAAGAILAAVTMIVNAIHHHGVIDTAVIIEAAGAVGALFTRQVVTPVADPKNGAGVPLVTAGSLTSLAPGQYTQTAGGAVVPANATTSPPGVATVIQSPPAP
jgi:hypothetical protein